jgi:hypothetical protein
MNTVALPDFTRIKAAGRPAVSASLSAVRTSEGVDTALRSTSRMILLRRKPTFGGSPVPIDRNDHHSFAAGAGHLAGGRQRQAEPPALARGNRALLGP